MIEITHVGRLSSARRCGRAATARSRSPRGGMAGPAAAVHGRANGGGVSVALLRFATRLLQRLALVTRGFITAVEVKVNANRPVENPVENLRVGTGIYVTAGTGICVTSARESMSRKTGICVTPRPAVSRSGRRRRDQEIRSRRRGRPSPLRARATVARRGSSASRARRSEASPPPRSWVRSRFGSTVFDSLGAAERAMLPSRPLRRSVPAGGRGARTERVLGGWR